MTNVFRILEQWLTDFNVQVLGLKPFHLNLVKIPILMLGGALLLWALSVRSSEKAISRWIRHVQEWSPWRCTVMFGSVLSAGLCYLSLKQFYAFRSEAYDLGIYSNALWHTIHGQWLFDALKNEHLLGDHFGPVLVVFAPLYYLSESPVWLLLAQALALGLGAVALGVVAHRLTSSTPMVLLLLTMYTANPYLHSVAALDFHPIVFAVPLFLWLLHCLDTERYRTALALAGLALLVEESLPPALLGIGLYLSLFASRYRWTGGLIACVASIWFLVEVTIVLPHFSQHSLIHWDRYANLGPDFRSALHNLATDPVFLLNEAFLSHRKYYYLLALLFSVGFLPLFAWRQATLIILPALMMLLSGNGGHYKFGFHYSAAILPFLFYASAYGLAGLQKRFAHLPEWIRSPRSIVSVVLVLLLVNVYQIRGYRLSHVDKPHVEAIKTVLQLLPRDSSVRAEGNLVAMLSSRHRIAPIVDEVDRNFGWWSPEYFVFDFKHVSPDPTHWAARRALIDYLANEAGYRAIIQLDDVAILRCEQKNIGCALGGP